MSTTKEVIECPNPYLRLALVRENGKVGFVNEENGQEVFPCIYDSVVDVRDDYTEFVDGQPKVKKSYFNYCCAKVKKDGKWGFITNDGKTVVPCVYDEIYDFDYAKHTYRMEGPYLDFFADNIAAVKSGDKWGLITRAGEVLARCVYEEIFIPSVELFYENRVAVKQNGLWGFLDQAGKNVTPFIYEAVGSEEMGYSKGAYTFTEGLAIVKKGGKWGAIDTTGNKKVPFLYDYISSWGNKAEKTAASKEGKWGYINKKGQAVIPQVYDDIKWFERGVCPVKQDGLWGFIDENGEIVAPMVYEDILVSEVVSDDDGLWFFSQDGYCAVKKEGKWGLIDADNNTVIHFGYDGIKFTSTGLDDWRYFYEGLTSVQKGKYWSVINKNELNHIPFEYDNVERWSNGQVCVQKNGKWGLVDSLGNELVPIEHNNKYAMDAGNYQYEVDKAKKQNEQ